MHVVGVFIFLDHSIFKNNFNNSKKPGRRLEELKLELETEEIDGRKCLLIIGKSHSIAIKCAKY